MGACFGGLAGDAMSTPRPRILCFGEVLWDCLPSGRLPGGAPLNVAYHLHRLGAEALVVSAVGRDALGGEMLAHLDACGLSTEYIARHDSLPTGTVGVELGADGQPSYAIHRDVAWDAIPCDERVFAAAHSCDALVFGSLAARTAANRSALAALRATPCILRIMDVNLRPPFAERADVLALAGDTDWIKLNEHELADLTGMPPGWPHDILPALETLRAQTGCGRVCVTAGARGAALWADGELHIAEVPAVQVCDTIGAGDAFTAALLHGLLTMPGDRRRILQRACALGALVASLPGGQPAYDAEMAIGGGGGSRTRS